MTAYASCTPRALTTDPEPFADYYGERSADEDQSEGFYFNPRPWYDPATTHPTNLVIAQFRASQQIRRASGGFRMTEAEAIAQFHEGVYLYLFTEYGRPLPSWYTGADHLDPREDGSREYAQAFATTAPYILKDAVDPIEQLDHAARFFDRYAVWHARESAA